MIQAGQLFLISEDLAPLMVFAAGLTGRNPETLKEMPADLASSRAGRWC